MQQAQAPEFLDGAVAVAFVSADIYQSESAPGYVVTIDGSGKTRIAKAGKLDNGRLASNDKRQISVTSETTSYVLGRPSVSEFKRGGRQETGHWAGTREDRSFVNVFNTGAGANGYETDIYWSVSSEPKHSVMRDVPGAMGIVDDILYSTNSGSSIAGGVVTLFETILRDEPKTEPAFTWRHRGSGEGLEVSEGSDIFGYAGKLWFLETMRSSEEATLPNGSGEQLRLAEVDPSTKKYASTELASYQVSKIEADQDSPPSAIAIASQHGHLYDGKIYTLDHTGSIFAIDLSTKEMRSVGKVGPGGTEAYQAAISWRGNAMTLLYYGADLSEPAKLQTYDLDTGEITQDTKVKGLTDLIQRDPDKLILWDVAALRASEGTVKE